MNIKPYATTDWSGSLRCFGITTALYFLTIFPLHPAIWIIFRSLVLLRIFITVHDCSHNSLFPTQRANSWIGMILGAIVLTPMKQWRRGHNYHHQNSGNLAVVCLERAARSGDTIFFTRREWDATRGTPRRLIRIFRDPLVFFTLIPFLLFFVAYRIPGRYTRFNTLLTTLGKMAELAVITHINPNIHISHEVAACWLGAIMGVALFHLQHGVNRGYRRDPAEYSPQEAAIEGATYLTFIPWWLKWATMGIEYHHIHHLNTQVPGYKLALAHDSQPPGTWKDVNHVGFLQAAKAMRNVMWNEETQEYESFCALPAIRSARHTEARPPVPHRSARHTEIEKEDR